MDITLYYAPRHLRARALHHADRSGGRFRGPARSTSAAGSTCLRTTWRSTPSTRSPLLVVDGEAMTESTAIQVWIARTFPEAGLLPDDPWEELRAISLHSWLLVRHPPLSQPDQRAAPGLRRGGRGRERGPPRQGIPHRGVRHRRGHAGGARLLLRPLPPRPMRISSGAAGGPHSSTSTSPTSPTPLPISSGCTGGRACGSCSPTRRRSWTSSPRPRSAPHAAFRAERAGDTVRSGRNDEHAVRTVDDGNRARRAQPTSLSRDALVRGTRSPGDLGDRRRAFRPRRNGRLGENGDDRRGRPALHTRLRRTAYSPRQGAVGRQCAREQERFPSTRAIEILAQRKRTYSTDEIAERAGQIVLAGIANGVTRMAHPCRHRFRLRAGRLRCDAGAPRALRGAGRFADRGLSAKGHSGGQRHGKSAAGSDGPRRRRRRRHAVQRDRSRRESGTYPDRLRYRPGTRRRHRHACRRDGRPRRAHAGNASARRRPRMAGRGGSPRVTPARLAGYPDEYAAQVIGAVAEAGVNVIVNPATKPDAAGSRRSAPQAARYHAGQGAAGKGGQCCPSARTIFATCFYPFGCADPLELALLLAHAAHMSQPRRDRHAVFHGDGARGACASRNGLRHRAGLRRRSGDPGRTISRRSDRPPGRPPARHSPGPRRLADGHDADRPRALTKRRCGACRCLQTRFPAAPSGVIRSPPSIGRRPC